MGTATLVHIILVLIVLGLAWWLLQKFVLPRLAEPFPTIIIVVLVVALILWLLGFLGMGTHFNVFRN